MASPHVATYILDAHKFDMAAYEEFKRNWLEGERAKAHAVPRQNNKEDAEDVFRCPKEDFCKQLKQRHSSN